MPHNALHPPSILLIEDEPSLREDIAEELQTAGYHVSTCGNGEQALDMLTDRRYSLILCDISMPVMDGYTLLETLHRQRPDCADIPFVFLTAQAAPSQIAQGKRAGADDYLVKPIDFDVLLATIETRLRQLDRLKNLHLNQGTTPPVAQINTLQNMLDSLAVNLIMLAANGQVVFANKMALASFGLQGDESLAVLIQALAIQETDQLTQAIQHLITSRDEAAHCLALTSAAPGNPGLLVTLCALEPGKPAQHSQPADLNTQPCVSVMIASGPSPHLDPPMALLQRLYDLTPTEARIAWAFTQGKRSHDIAAQFQVSPTTVAFHKRNIFLKTQTNRQADLIALLLSLPLV